jgi:glutathione synthase/RimK-type ligase-like ATP-grasp enzyme
VSERTERSERSERTEVTVLYEHPEWQKPLFAALERRGVSYATIDLKRAAFEPGEPPRSRLVFNQASATADVRRNTRAVPLALAYLKALEHEGISVVNGARAFALELSKTAQAAMIRRLGLRTPRSITFNDVDALAAVLKETTWVFPSLLKPEQGGSGARIEKVGSLDEIRALLDARPELWIPDGLFLLQEYVESDVEKGIVRMELLGGELLYAMRVKAHGRFNLCPSEVCNPADGAEGACEVPAAAAAPPVEFYAYPEIPAAAVAAGKRIAAAAGIDIGGIEYLEANNGELVFYDVNANSNLRPAIAREFGFDPFDRVVDYLIRRARG